MHGSKMQVVAIDDIKREILENGPVISQMVVYEDLLGYQSGVYEHREGSIIGGHAVLIVGWGLLSHTNDNTTTHEHSSLLNHP